MAGASSRVLSGATIVDLPDSGSHIILTIAQIHEPRYWVRWKIERALSQIERIFERTSKKSCFGSEFLPYGWRPADLQQLPRCSARADLMRMAHRRPNLLKRSLAKFTRQRKELSAISKYCRRLDTGVDGREICAAPA
jgi:hypothetical protein